MFGAGSDLHQTNSKNGVESTARVLPREHRDKYQRRVHGGRLPHSSRSKERRLDSTHQLFCQVTERRGWEPVRTQEFLTMKHPHGNHE